ncbi:uncharacterized protein LOC141586296 isoform X2 [Silene latifolia]|uniref:uncharacterized protein LOC141586296 isoform X2 n=1 Tax=Silene latifolia TaxID=37657 RepID=UPI003D76F446
MDKPADESINQATINNNGVDLRSPDQKVPRKRFIQSTLFPLKPHGNKSDNSVKNEVKKVEEIKVVDNVVNVDDDDDVVECCGSQGGKKKRGKPKLNSTPQKRRSKKVSEGGKEDGPVLNSTPQKRRSKKVVDGGKEDCPVSIDDTESPDDGTPQKLKEKQRTPARRGRTSSNKKTPTKTPTRQVSTQQVPQVVPDLWQEAKKTAEENSRIFAGKQIHPFFSSFKAGKKDQEIIELESEECLDKRKERRAEFNPIHVFEDDKDNVDFHDWSSWTFFDGPFSKDFASQASKTPSLEGTYVSLNPDAGIASNPCGISLLCKDVSSSQFYDTHEHTSVITRPVSSVVVDDEGAPIDLLQNLEREFGDSDEHNSDLELQNLLQDSMMSHYLNRANQPENSLWTKKYQPEKASEVCGNGEAVKFINDWLRLWHAEDFKVRKKSCNSDSFVVDDEYDSDDSASDPENGDEQSSLKNVLLVSGPVGSGKSAAIYACAKEQGFEVIEVNASDWRSGAILKQKFGEAVGLHWLKRSQETPMGSQGSQRKLDFKSSSMLGHEVQALDLNEDAVEVISLSEEESVIGAGIQTNGDGRLSTDQDEIKTLLLFEDVDATLCEDRGFISTIQQLADTGRRPMVLTSNSENPELPNNLDREEISFRFPSLKELVHHICLVCTAENANVHPHLIERCIDFCGGDIRKSLMLLQFWCQRKGCIKDGKKQSMHSPSILSLAAMHYTLPKLIPWGLPSSLSEFIEAEIANLLCKVEKDQSLLDKLVEDEGIKQDKLDIDDGEAGIIEAKKEAIIRANCFLHVDDDNIAFSSLSEFSNCSGSPIAFTRRNTRRKLDIVFSDSEEEFPSHEKPAVSNGFSLQINHNLLPAVNNNFPDTSPVFEGMPNKFGDRILNYGTADVEETRHHFSAASNANHINSLAVGNSCNKQTDFFVRSTEANFPEIKDHCRQLLDLNHSYCEEPRDSFNQFNGEFSQTHETLMEVSVSQFPTAPHVHEEILTMGTAKNQTDQPNHSGSDYSNHTLCLMPGVSTKQIDRTETESVIHQSLKTSNTNFTGFQPDGNSNSMSPLGGKGLKFFEAKSEEQQYQCSDATNVKYMIDPCWSIDVSCVPDSTFVPETEVNDGMEIQAGKEMDIVSPLTTADVDTSIRMPDVPEIERTGIDINLNVQNEDIDDSQSDSEHLIASTSGCQVMDECSRMDFCKKPKRLRISRSELKFPVQDRWNELKLADLRQRYISEHENALQMLDIAFGVSNLISEGDLLLHDCESVINDSYNEDICFSEETFTFGWHDQQVQMASVIAEHGYYLYAKDINALQLKMGADYTLHLNWELLTSINNSATLGKLLRLNRSKNQVSPTLEARPAESSSTRNCRLRETHLTNIVQSITPSRSYLTSRGNALHDYLSSLAHISRSEASRLAEPEAAQKTKRRRVRATKNYLSSGALDLSPDDISLLKEYYSYGKIST